MNLRKYVNLIALCIASASCAMTGGESRHAIVMAVDASARYASRDGVDLAKYQATSAVLLSNGRMDLLDIDRGDMHTREVIGKLKKRQYWQICYTINQPRTVAPTYCYFIERDGLSLIETYHMK